MVSIKKLMPSKDNPQKKIDLGQLNDLIKQEKDARRKEEIKWKINLAFYKNHHYTYYNHRTHRIDEKPTDAESLPQGRVRLQSNKVRSVATTKLAKMTKSDPTFQGIPATTDQSDAEAAKLGQMLFEYHWTEQELMDKRNDAVMWSILTGQGFWEIYWDKNANVPITNIIDPETGEPVVNPAREEALKTQERAGAIQLERQTIHVGDLGVEVVSPLELYLLGGKTPKQAWGAVKTKGYTQDEVKEKWGVDLEPDGQSDNNDVSTDKANTKKDLVIINCLWIKPNSQVPKGRMVVFSKNKVIDDQPFPYEHGQLPFIKFKGVSNPDGKYDDSVITDVIPLNRALNRLMSQVQEYNNRMIKPQWWAPVGSVQGRRDNTPGAINTYLPINGHKPEPEDVKPLPNFILSWIDVIEQQINDVSGQHEITQGKVPPNVEAGVAIGLLEEQDDTRLHPEIKAMEQAISQAGTQMLALYKQYAIEQRILKISGSDGIAKTRAFKNSDLYGCEDIRVVPGSTIPNSQAAQNDWIWKGIEAGHIDPREGFKVMKVGGGMNEIISQWEADKRKQQREIEKLIRGEDIDPPIAEIDDHEAHISVIDLFVKSEEWDAHDPEVKVRVLEHRAGHAEFLAGQPEALPENVKVNYQIKDDGTPSTTAAILQKSGVPEADPQMIADEGSTERWEEGQAYIQRFDKSQQNGGQSPQSAQGDK